MKVQMIAGISGTRNGTDWPPVGGYIDVPDAEAADLIRAGLASVPEKKKSAPAPETAVAAKAETRKGLTTKSI